MKKASIWKFRLKPSGGSKDAMVMMPKGAKVLTIQVQDDIPNLWAMVDPDAPQEPRLFEIFATGDEINYDIGTERNYIGTFQLYNGTLVFHVFEYRGI